MMPGISVIMPVFNAERYLEKALDSILQQDFTDFELICIDDASTDNSQEIIREYSKRDDRIKCLINNHNKKQGYSRNIGLSAAKGKYIFFADSDDRVMNGAFETLYSLAEEENADLIYFGFQHIFDREFKKCNIYRENYFSGKTLKSNEKYDVYEGARFLYEMLCRKCYSNAIARHFIRRQYLEDNNLRFQDRFVLEDVLFSFLALINASRVIYLKKEYYQYWRHLGSTTDQRDKYFFSYSLFHVIDEIYRLWMKYDNEKEIGKSDVVGLMYRKLLADARRIYANLPPEEIKLLKENLSISKRKQTMFSILVEEEYLGCLFDDIENEKLEVIKKYSRIVIFGAGEYGKETYRFLKRNGLSVWKFVVSSCENNCQELYGIPVIELSKLKYTNETLIIIGVSAKYRTEIEVLLREKKYTNILEL